MPQNQFTRQSLIAVVDRALDVLTVAAAAAIPLFFLPITSEAFFINKHFLMFALAAVMLVLWTVGFVLKKQVKVTVSPLLLPMFLVAAGTVAAQIFSATGGGGSIAEALIGRMGLYFSAFIIFMVGSSRRAEVGRWLVGALAVTAAVLGGASVLAAAGVYQSFGLADYTKIFTPAGGLAGALVVELAGLAVVLAGLKSKSTRDKQDGDRITQDGNPASSGNNPVPSSVLAVKQLGLILAALLIVSGAIIAGIMLFPGQPGASGAMTLKTGWQIAIETLKEKPFTGVGTAAYLSAFTKYRPIAANAGDLWNQRFLQAPNEILQTFTSTGLIGLVTLLLLVYQLYRLSTQDKPDGDGITQDPAQSGVLLGLLIVAASMLVLPLNVVTLSLLVTLMTALVLQEKAATNIMGEDHPSSIIHHPSSIYDAVIGLVALRDRLPAVFTTVLPWVVLVLSVILAGGTFFLTGRAWAAEITYRQALVAIINNNGTEAYNKLIQTIQWNPFIDTYHRQYADVNLRLANSLAGQQNLTDQDRINVSQLVQQSIREGKIAVQLDPEDVQNWEILARTYRALINVAQGAGDWTLVSYGEAIRRDPVNPLLRLELGGVFYNLKDWESAIRNFQAAVNLKPDYANGYYNLALAYEQDNRPERAAGAMQAALSNLRADSPDYQAAQNKLTELLDKAKSSGGSKGGGGEAGGAGTELKGPEPLPTPLPGANRVKLGEEEQPPVTPTPTASPTPSVSPTPSAGPTPSSAP